MTPTGKSLLTGAFAICISAMLWGLDGIVLTPQLYNLELTLVVFILHALPFLIMNVFLYREYKLLKSFTGKDLIYLFLIALMGGALGTMAIVRALFLVEFRDLTIVVLLQKLQPVFAISLAAILLREKFKKNFILWASLAIVAGYFLTFGFNLPDLNTGSKTALAAVYSLFAAFAFGSATVLSKGILHRISFQAATFYRYGFTSLIMLVIVLITGSFSNVAGVTKANWIVFLIITFTTGSGAIFLYYFGLRKVKAMVATICELCFPLSAIIFDYIFHGRMLTPVQWISAAIMLIAIVKLSLGSNSDIPAEKA
ncbi:MAG: DMT family transporter [Bacteroidales bacterium]|nr:DMT family transporter [Bacteroidales bacterium]MBK9357245.1 DMT family transporter [Bacteroidales bacterium]